MITEDVATSTCTHDSGSGFLCTTPQGALTGNVSFQLNIIIFFLTIIFVGLLFNSFGGRRR